MSSLVCCICVQIEGYQMIYTSWTIRKRIMYIEYIDNRDRIIKYYAWNAQDYKVKSIFSLMVVWKIELQ